MDLNINQLVRSGVVLVVGLPISIALALSLLPETSQSNKTLNEEKASLTKVCLEYAFSSPDGKAEREAKNQIDERFGDKADYKGVCDWVLR